MKTTLTWITLALAATVSSCSLVEVENPNITDETFLGTPESAEVWLNGLQKQLAQTLNQTVVFAEMVSDNYYNNSSLSNQVFDIPTLLPEDLDIDNVQRELARLRAMAVYGVERVVPAAADGTREQLAEMYFYAAYASLLSGELFASLPAVEAGPVLPATAHLENAVGYLQQGLSLTADAGRRTVYTLALARAYHGLGDRQRAAQLAQEVIAADPLVLRNAVFDGLNGASNLMQTYTFSSSTNTLAPLPRLDFLDPKYFHVGNASADQKPIALLKGEEAFLIAAEAAIGNGDLPGAKALLTRLVGEVVSARPVASVDGRHAERKGTRSDYPLSAATKVRFAPGGPLREGLVLGRGDGNITVHRVSGTSVTEAEIAAAGDADALLYLLCLLRQEIFMSEGRRMTDLGIRFPISTIEQQNNPNVSAQDTRATIPPFIPGQLGMDDFEHDEAAGVVTILHDMNRVLVANKASAGILPLVK